MRCLSSFGPSMSALLGRAATPMTRGVLSFTKRSTEFFRNVVFVGCTNHFQQLHGKSFLCTDIDWVLHDQCGSQQLTFYPRVGRYTAENTLLIDDDASKAALNPPHTCINPATYAGGGEEEDRAATRGGLAPDGELRQWLHRLLHHHSSSSSSASSMASPSSVAGIEGEEAEGDLADIPSFVAANRWPPLAPAKADPSEISLGSEDEEQEQKEETSGVQS